MTLEEEQRKATFDRRTQLIVTATADVFFNGDEDLAWRKVFAVEDERQPYSPPPPTATRIHLVATHQ